jgi:hypothetical protein
LFDVGEIPRGHFELVELFDIAGICGTGKAIGEIVERLLTAAPSFGVQLSVIEFLWLIPHTYGRLSCLREVRHTWDDSQAGVMLEHFSRHSQSIKDAAEPADKDKAHRAAILVVHSVGVMSAPKRTAHPSDFSEATDFIGGAIKTAREAKQAKFQDTKKTEDQPAKSLAQLLLEAEETE